ncbi:MAG TPA: hypothetical protein VGF44_03260 [Terriglobales bacterium]
MNSISDEQSWLELKHLRTLWPFAFFGYGAIFVAWGVLFHIIGNPIAWGSSSYSVGWFSSFCQEANAVLALSAVRPAVFLAWLVASYVYQ